MENALLENVLIEGFDVEKFKKLQNKEEKAISRGWEKVYGAYQNNKVLQSKVVLVETIGTIPCAVIQVEGVRGIIPIEHYDDKISRKRELEKEVGSPVAFKITSYDEKNEIFTASRIEALELMASLRLSKLEVGDTTPAVVKNVMPHGLIVDVGGITTSLSLEEIRYGWIDDLDEEYKKGDHLMVKVLNILTHVEQMNEANEKLEDKVKEELYPERKRFNEDEKEEIQKLVDERKLTLGHRHTKIKVSAKALMKNPWDHVNENFRKNQVREGVVSGVSHFGVFVRLDEGIDSLASHLKYENFTKGEKVQVRIRDIDIKNEQIRSRIIGRI